MHPPAADATALWIVARTARRVCHRHVRVHLREPISFVCHLAGDRGGNSDDALAAHVFRRNVAHAVQQRAGARMNSPELLTMPIAPASPPGRFEKAKLLLQLLPSRPMEFYDRLQTMAACFADRSSEPARTPAGTPAALLEALSRRVGKHLDEIVKEPALAEIERNVRQSQAELASVAAFGTFHNADFALSRLCYAVCRARKPRVVVETGVAFGVTTAFILKALEQNGSGELHSVDLPPLGRAAEKQVGSLVPVT